MPSFRHLAGLVGVAVLASPHPMPELTGGWQSTGPVLYQVNAVATTPAADAAVYAAASIYQASQSAIFRSSDGGNTWDPLVEAPSGEFYSEIFVDPRQPQRIYAGSFGSAGTASTYLSTDEGQTWSHTHTVSPSCSPSFAPGSVPDAVLAACGQKALRSRDGGATWTELTTPFLEPARLIAGRSGAVLAYTTSTIFRSTNDGDSWMSIASAPAACPSLLALRADPTDGNVLVAGTAQLGAHGVLCGGVFRSGDGGISWGDNALPGLYVTDVAIDPRTSSTIFASIGSLNGILPRGGVFESGDGGATWTNLNVPASSAVRLALSPSGRLLHAATPIGVFDRGFRRTLSLAPRK